MAFVENLPVTDGPCAFGAMPSQRSRRLPPVCAAVALSAVVVGGPAVPSAHAADSLATPITSSMARELWPIEVTVELAALRSANAATDPLPTRTIVVPDGHRLRFSSTVPTSSGRQRFELTVVPRHHPDTIEVEWDLEVHEARFRPIGWKRYLERRFGLDGDLELGEERLKIARSDIVSTEDDHIRIRFDVDGESFEIRMLAMTTRG